MKKRTSRLLLFTLFAVFLYGGSLLMSRTASSAFTPLQDCKQGCTQRRDVSLKRCERLTGDSKTNCQNSANEQYNKCVEACDNGGSNVGGSSGKP